MENVKISVILSAYNEEERWFRKAVESILNQSFKEFELLTYFMENEGIALSREKILNHVWNYDYFGDARTIDTHVKKLRSKLGSYGGYIKTVWGIGYKFEAEE